MKARVESGFWVFRAPIGYRYVSAQSGGGKVLVPDEQIAPIVRQALEGFATGPFASQAEVWARYADDKGGPHPHGADRGRGRAAR
jgi:site-specific DNA recombinase